MAKLRPVSWREVEKVVLKNGCTFEGQEGSHRKYWRKDFTRPIMLPKYKSIPRFIVMKIIKALKISKKEFYNIV